MASIFSVFNEPVTRTDFEHVIRHEINMVDNYLDDLLRNAGLTNSDIDRVIRTGGSSQIPAFIQLLERRFGKEKVGSIDLFSSVTAGLGLMAHEIEEGRIDTSPYYQSDYTLEDRLDHRRQNGIPAVDFDLMKKFIALVETQPSHDLTVGIAGLTEDHEVIAVIQPPETYKQAAQLEAIGVTRSGFQMVFGAAPDDTILVCTSNYRFLRKTLSQLVQLNEVGLDLAKSEGFQLDVFGNEYVTGLTPWRVGSRTGDIGILVTTSGYFRSMKAEPLLARLEQAVAYQPERLKGDPLAIMLADEADNLLVFTSSGRAVSIPAKWLVQQREGRLIRVPRTERIVSVWAIRGQQAFLLAAEDGEIMALNATDVPVADLNLSGTKVFRHRRLKSVLPWYPHQAVWMMTSKRIMPLKTENIEANDTPFRPLKLHKGETLTALLALPMSVSPSPLSE